VFVKEGIMTGTVEKIRIERDDLKTIYTKSCGQYKRSFITEEMKLSEDNDRVMLRILVKLFEKESA
jgi:hypothetical protein